MLILLVSRASGATPKTLPSVRPASCLPGNPGSTLLEISANPRRHQLPARIRLLGFSRSGRLALLEQREGEEIEGGLWTIRVIDLETNTAILHEELETEVDNVPTFCERHGEKLSQILKTHQIETAQLPRLARFPLKRGGDRISLALRPTAKNSDGIRLFEMWLYWKDGARNLVAIEQIHAESGKDPVGAPRVLGVMTSPWEARIAVLIRQDLTATEAAVVPLVHVYGVRL